MEDSPMMINNNWWHKRLGIFYKEVRFTFLSDHLMFRKNIKQVKRWVWLSMRHLSEKSMPETLGYKKGAWYSISEHLDKESWERVGVKHGGS